MRSMSFILYILYLTLLYYSCYNMFYRKYATTDGQRYFWEVRYVTSTFDISPKGLLEVERVVKSDEGVLRHFTTKVESASQRFNSRSYKNPYFETKYQT